MILIVFLLSLLAQISSTPKPAEYGSIEGVVVDPQGMPIAGASVYSVGNEEGKRPLGGRWPPGPTTTADSQGNFVLEHVVPDNPVSVYASKETDYYSDGVLNPFVFQRLKTTEVNVKVGQSVLVTVRLAQKVGRIHLFVRDADTKELVGGVSSRWCRKGEPAKYCNAGGMSGPSDFQTLVLPNLPLSIQVEAQDGLHEKSEYRNAKTGSRYFRAKSGETETVNIYVRKKRP